MKNHVGRSVVLAAVVLATAGRAHAGGFGIPEVGVRRTGMATIIGRPDDASALYHNPAGLILQPGVTVYMTVGLSLLNTEFRLRPWEMSDEYLMTEPEADGYYAPVKPSRAMGVIPMLAATVNIIPDKLTLGGGVYVGNATGAAFDREAVTRYHLVDGYVVAPQAVVAAAYRVHDTLTIGANVGVINLRVHGKREIYPLLKVGEDTVNVTNFFGNRGELTLDGEGWAPTWQIAAFGQPHPRVTYGVTVTGRVDAKLTGPIRIEASEGAVNPDDVYEGEQTTTQLLPWAFMGGVSVDASSKLELAGEFRYWLYRQYDQQYTAIRNIALIEELVTQKNYSDSWAASIGARVHDLAAAPGLDLMAGLQYDKSPAPPSTVTLDQPSFSHPAVHLGARYSTGRYRFGASYIHYWYLVPTITDSTTSPPSNIKGSGTNNIFTVSIEASL